MNRLRQARIAAGLSQVELARLSRTASNWISALERGQTRPWPAVVTRLTEALGCRPEDLFSADDLQYVKHLESKRRGAGVSA